MSEKTKTELNIPKQEEEKETKQPRQMGEKEAQVSHEVFRALSSFVHGYLNGNYWSGMDANTIINCTLHGLTLTLCYYSILGKLSAEALSENIKGLYDNMESQVKAEAEKYTQQEKEKIEQQLNKK